MLIAPLFLAALALAEPPRSTQDAQVQAVPPAIAGPYELTLEDAYRIALQNNLGLKLEAANTEVVLYNYRATWGVFDWVIDARAGYSDGEFPTRSIFDDPDAADSIERRNTDFGLDLTRPIALTGGTFRTNFSSNEERTTSGSATLPRSTFDILSLQYTQPLLRGAWRDYATAVQREGQLDARRADETLRRARHKLLLDVSNAYWNLVAARDALAVAESSLNLARAQTDRNQRLLDAGMGTPVEVLQAEAGAATREEGRLRAEVDVKKAVDDLKLLLGPGKDPQLWETELTPTTPLPEANEGPAVPEWTTAFAIAVDMRPELREQRLLIDSASVRHGRARVDKRPALDLDLSASSQGFADDRGEALETTSRFDFPTYRAGLVFNYALGSTSASNLERAAWAEVRAARLSYDEQESRIAAEVRAGVRQVLYQSEAIRAADKSLELSRRQLAAEELRFQNGDSTTFAILEFQQDLALAMSNTRRARAEHAKALAVLASAQGLLGEARGP